jgi:putative transposase
MKRLQAYKFELMPNGEQQRKMRRFAGACRFVYNRALAWQKAQYEKDPSNKFSYTVLQNQLPGLKQIPTTAWLKESPSQILRGALRNLETSYKNFFAKRSDFPKFKKKGMGDSFRYPQGCKLEQENNRLFLPKLGWVRYRNSRAVLGEIKNITISQSNGKWYASIQTEREVEQTAHLNNTLVGVDMGVSKFATLSTGEIFPPVNSFRAKQARLACYQRAMSRKTKFSKNWLKAKRKISKIHSTIANIRRDYLHKTSAAISKNHAVIVIEDLQVRNMSKSAQGSSEKNGRNVKAKSGLNKSILDQGWFEFRRQLEYKQAWLSGQVIAVPPQYTSQRCACCGHTAKDNRLTQSKFACLACGYTANADHNAAQNILAAGLAVIACGEVVLSGPSVKQEPTEGRMLFQHSPVGIPVL